MFKYLKLSLLLLSIGALVACGESEAPQKAVTTESVEETASVAMEEVVATVEEAATEVTAATETQVAETVTTVEETTEEVVNKVEETVSNIAEEVKEQVEAATESISSDKPYQLVDGAISANALEGWKTYNGGGCGACHGKGGIGAVGPNLANSVKTNLTEEQFKDIVTNGKSGTMMRAHKTNKRVMDNLDNLYAYLVARGDDVLGPGNLIKMPLGK